MNCKSFNYMSLTSHLIRNLIENVLNINCNISKVYGRSKKEKDHAKRLLFRISSALYLEILIENNLFPTNPLYP